MTCFRRYVPLTVALPLLLATATGCGTHGASAASPSPTPPDRYTTPSATTCSSLVEYAVDEQPPKNTGDCAGSINTRPADPVPIHIGQHLYVYIGPQAHSDGLSTPRSSQPKMLHLTYASRTTIEYAATATGNVDLTTRSRDCFGHYPRTTTCVLLHATITT